ncbi:Hint domain-containing protein [Ruegeria sp.]|uniref:Hint domain-containing protein n=1 Tax=Ruegeria sp. TaxID=1879320 RepID=UPI003B599062
MAFISEIHYQDFISLAPGGEPEFLEVTLSVDEAARSSDFVVSLYQADGSLAAEVSLDTVTSFPHPTSPGFVIFQVGVSDVPAGIVQGGTSFLTGPDNGGGPVEAYALTDTGPGGDVISFFEIDGVSSTSNITAVGGAADGLTTTTIPPAPTGSSVQFDFFGNRVDEPPTPTTSVVCFCSGTLIETTEGVKKVEDLRPSCSYPANADQVVTISGEARPLRWIGRTAISAAELEENHKLRPIRITAGALGNNLPVSDLLVSRQHRMLISSDIARTMFGVEDVLISAIKLTALPGVFVDDSVKEVEYFHVLLDSHEVVIANGAPSESLFLGPEALNTLSEAHVEQVRNLLPEQIAPDIRPEAAAFIPENHQQKEFVSRYQNVA